ncbi:MAG: putative CRISPR-associated RAMP Cmr1 [Promethearchaeota archaeon]|jgi:CRISPR-associated protein Cmr1|nr:MAG: putative CRISPR-associated RAMP Cmr1 [Candidatus Lokiarchaeota archaeon]
MNWIDSEWEVITPMFLHGYNTRRVELRTPPIKSLMRYWWRSLHGELTTEELYNKEAEYFGSADKDGKKSKFQLRILPYKQLPQKEYKLLSTKNFTRKAIQDGFKFTIRIQSYLEDTFLKRFFLLQYLSLVLGGLGQRTRRGAGALRFIEITDSNIDIEFDFGRDIIIILSIIIEQMTNLNYKLDKQNKRIVLDENLSFSNFPYLKSITIGREFTKWIDIKKKIDEQCHLLKRQYRQDYNSMGFAHPNEKLASPLYISVIKENDKYFPIMSKLNYVPPNGTRTPNDVDEVPNIFISSLC